MRKTIRSVSIAIGAIAFAATSAIASPALADNTWISGPTLTRVAISTTGAVATSSGFTLSTQTTSFTLTYRGPAGDAGKFAQVNFFDLSSGLSIALTSTPTASSTGCDQQVLGGDSRSCMFKLDGSGSANINGTLAGVTSASALKYHLLSGPNIAQTGDANIAFAVPNTTVKAVATSVKAMVGGAGVVRFRFFNGKVAAGSVKANVSLKGRGDHLSSTTVTSDSNGYAWVYVASLSKKTGLSTVTVTVDGTANKAVASIKWVTGKLGK
ncbi:MAG: hypothetical protein RL196_559 [Actinomycetota bacterium]|jgi:hypothetical protein